MKIKLIISSLQIDHVCIYVSCVLLFYMKGFFHTTLARYICVSLYMDVSLCGCLLCYCLLFKRTKCKKEQFTFIYFCNLLQHPTSFISITMLYIFFLITGLYFDSFPQLSCCIFFSLLDYYILKILGSYNCEILFSI